MNCEQWREWIQREQDGDLSPVDRERLAHHLSTCSRCAEAARELEAISRLLSSLPRPEPPVSLVDRVLQEATSPPAGSKGSVPRHRSRKWLFRGVPVAAAIILAVIGLNHEIPIGGGEKSRTDSEAFQTKARVDESITAPATSGESAPTVESFVSGEGEWSPGGDYQAVISEGRVMVRDRNGEAVYQSQPLKRSEKVRLEWAEVDTLTIRFPEGKTKRIQLPDPGTAKPGS